MRRRSPETAFYLASMAFGEQTPFHLASAVRGRTERFMTWDNKGFQIGQTVAGLRVQEPKDYGQETFLSGRRP